MHLIALLVAPAAALLAPAAQPAAAPKAQPGVALRPEEVAFLDAITCDDLLGGNYEAFDPGCALAVADPSSYYGVIFEIAQEFIEAETGR